MTAGVTVRTVTPELVADVDTLFATSDATRGCYCTWFLIPVARYHANGRDGNRAIFCQLVEHDTHPVGALAYVDEVVAGWCASGPRGRYVRAVKAPSFAGNDPSEDDSVWLVPCLYVKAEARRGGVARALVQNAMDVARQHGASAIEAMPFAAGAKPGHNLMVGTESLFSSCGFAVARRPTPTRVVMRHQLT